MQDQDIPVRILEVRLQTHPGVDRLAEELDTLPASSRGRFDVVDAQGDRAAVRRELAADRGGVEDLEGQVAGLELAAGDVAVFLATARGPGCRCRTPAPGGNP